MKIKLLIKNKNFKKIIKGQSKVLIIKKNQRYI